MKLLHCVIIFIFISVSTLLPGRVFFDVYGTALDTGSLAKDQTGGGVALGFNIHRDYSIIYRGSYTNTSRNENDDTFYHLTNMLGIEYLYTVYPRLDLKGSILLGYSTTEVDKKDMRDDDGDEVDKLSDSGNNYGIWLGAQYMINQWLAPFIDVGFHQSIYNNSFVNKEVYGYHIMVGVRFTLFGKNRSITSDY